jgi:hypothetical protein
MAAFTVRQELKAYLRRVAAMLSSTRWSTPSIMTMSSALAE